MRKRDLLIGGGLVLASGPAEAAMARGPRRVLLLGAPRKGTIYYVSLSGNDSNNGLSPGKAWLTITKVNAGVYKAGDTVLFQGGSTFSGAISLGTSNYSGTSPPTPLRPLTIGSYGAGQATISSASSGGFKALNIASLVVRDLIFTGAGIATAAVDGILFQNSTAANSRLPFVQVINCNVSAYGGNGIFFYGSGTTSAGFANGYDRVLVSNCTVTNCTGAAPVATNTAGIFFISWPGYGTGKTNPAFTNVTIQGCSVSGCTGKASGPTSWTGSGIVVGEIQNCVIQNCVAFNNGSLSATAAGPVGMFIFDCKFVTLQYCEAYLNSSANGDGDGFDIDGGCANCVIQYCYSHDNAATGFQFFSYNDGTVVSCENNTIRYCISQNNVKTTANSGELYISGPMTGCAAYNNVFYLANGVTTAATVQVAGTTSTCRVANNIFYNTGVRDAIKSANNATNVTFTGNCYWNTTGVPSFTWNTTSYSTFAAWQTATSQEKISAVNVGIVADPKLVAIGSGGVTNGYTPSQLLTYYLLTASTLKGAGLDLNSQFSIDPGAQDYFGNALAAGTGTGFNVGAYGGPGVASGAAVTIDAPSAQAGMVLSNGNLTATTAAGSLQCRSTTARATGKYHFEMTVVAGTSIGFGLMMSYHPYTQYLGQDVASIAWITGAPSFITWNNSGQGAAVDSYTSGQTIAIEVDLDGRLIWTKNVTTAGLWNNNGTANPATGVNGRSYSANFAAGKSFFVGLEPFSAAGSCTINFGATTFALTPSSGFVAWQ